MTEAQLRHAVEQFLEMVVVVVVVSLLAWAVLLAFGVLVHPLVCAGVSFVGYYAFSAWRDRGRWQCECGASGRGSLSMHRCEGDRGAP